MTEMQWADSHAAVTTAAWEAWTKNGLGMDDDMREQTAKHASDTANNAWQDGMTVDAWLAATLSALSANK
jgi:hypothetical protein